jgi:hypothetical protein
MAVALLTFFFPLVTIHLPIVGNQELSGYDVFAEPKNFSHSLNKLTSTTPSGTDSESTQSAPTNSNAASTKLPMPFSVRTLIMIPVEIIVSFICVLVALLCCFPPFRSVSAKPVATAGAVASVVAVLHLTIANSDLHKWFREYIVSGSSDHAVDPFAGLARQIGNLAANAVQLTPGAGLYVCAVALTLTTVLLHSRILSAIPSSEPVPTLEDPGKHRRAISVLVVIVIVVVGAISVASIAPSLHGPIPESQTEVGKSLGSQQASEEPAPGNAVSLSDRFAAQIHQPPPPGSALPSSGQISGTVTSKTTGQPVAGDPVVLIDVRAGMAEVAHATTDVSGHYSLNERRRSYYLVRVDHQGVNYFIAGPQGGSPGDIPVYDVSAKVQGVSIEADVIEVSADHGQLKVNERYLVHNTSSPPFTQWSSRSFEVVLPEDAVVKGESGQRPGGLPTMTKLVPDGPGGRYSFSFPIMPDEGEYDTLFEISYSLPYSGGKYTFKSLMTLPADSLAVLLPKSMTFTAGNGAAFKFVSEDPRVQTALLKNVYPGKAIEFTVSGLGSIPGE